MLLLSLYLLMTLVLGIGCALLGRGAPAQTPARRCGKAPAALLCALALLSASATSQERPEDAKQPSPVDLDELSLEELMNVEVVSVSKKKQELQLKILLYWSWNKLCEIQLQNAKTDTQYHHLDSTLAT